jgi:hypothetical protein
MKENKMKKSAVLIALVAVAFASAAPAQETGPAVRVVNLNAFGSTSPSDADLVDLATMNASKNSKLFPPADDFVVSIDPCVPGTPGSETGGFLVSSDYFSVDAMTKEVLPYRFAAVGGDAGVGKYSVVVVREDKSVDRFVAVSGASNSNTSLKTDACVLVGPKDTILTFVETAGSLEPPQEGTGGEGTTP